MWKRRLILPFLAALLMLGLTAGTALAQDNDEDQDDGVSHRELMEMFISQVAAELDVEEQEVMDAFSQAGGEVITTFLTNQVEDLQQQNVISEEEAQDFMDWWEDRPDAVDRVFLFLMAHHGQTGGDSEE